MRRLLLAALLLAPTTAGAQLYQVGDNLPCVVAFKDSSGALETGLTVTVDVLRDTTQVVTGASATEIGTTGLYRYVVDGATYVTAAGLYVCEMTDATKDGVVAFAVAPAHANLDAAVSAVPTAAANAAAAWAYSTRTLTSVSDITVVSPVATTGFATVIQGASYQAADSRALEWSGSSWPDLTGVDTITVAIRRGGTTTTYSASAVDADTLRLELTTAQTALLTPGTYDLQIEAATSGEVVPLVYLRDGFTVQQDFNP